MYMKKVYAACGVETANRGVLKVLFGRKPNLQELVGMNQQCWINYIIRKSETQADPLKERTVKKLQANSPAFCRRGAV